MSGFKGSPLPPITDTGMRGFLKWYQREQPALYKKIAPQISAAAPQVFSDYNQSVTNSVREQAGIMAQKQRTRVRGGNPFPQSRRLQGLGDDATPGADFGYSMNPDGTIDTSTFTGQGSDSPTITDLSLQTPSIDTADAANAGTTPGTTTSGIANLIAGVTGLYTTVNQQQTANAITQLQLQRASQGLSPLNIGMNANGVPTVSGISGSMGTVLLIGGGLALVLLLMGGSRKAA